MQQCARVWTHVTLRLDVGALADELLDHLEVPIPAGGVERR